MLHGKDPFKLAEVFAKGTLAEIGDPLSERIVWRDRRGLNTQLLRNPCDHLYENH